MSADSTSNSPDLDRLVGGEQEGLPPAPEGAPDDVDAMAPDERFQAPGGSYLEIDDEATDV
ncbi:hypothetical protein [Microbacterium oleivorans]|uniref:hypothetical protein n=1 Tax=Microbacterium oleivorans TaxID=273677 RepID=UPI0007678C74|nr:hypothetical protein [Microbacterium oleivorans]AZS43633.1 hypothetical protein BWL13_01197 [Microbacterium oleivorans]AZS43670.1 hypothetical protein BWL13_01235 [Microbacterium oleivorans]